MIIRNVFFWSIFMMAMFLQINAQQNVKYSPRYFGPNALPVPEVTNGKIPDYTQITFSTDYSFGFGDKTLAWRIDAEIPLLPKFIAIKAWMVVHEFYWLTPEVNYLREPDSVVSHGWSTGDFYAQTRFTILRETKFRPQIIGSITIKTATGGPVELRRYFDTPAYAFDVSIAKSFPINTKFLTDIRLVGDVGFLCWETSKSVNTQNDAGMYGFNFILSNSFLTLENQIGGYWGRLNNGDRPLTYRTKLTYNHKYLDIFFQYQYGIIDFPYHQIRLGFVVPIKKLTPRYPIKCKEEKKGNDEIKKN